MKIAILSNVNLDMLCDEVARSHEVFKTEGYGQWVSYALSRNEGLTAFSPKLILLLLDGNALLETCDTFSDGVAEINRCFAYISKLKENYPYSTVAVSNIDVCPNRIRPSSDENIELMWEAEWAKRLSDIAKSEHITVFDLKSIIAAEGRKSFYSEKLWYTGSIPYGIKSLKPLAAAINELTEHVAPIRKKVLVLDLDNTLWGGVAGEDGANGVTLSESLIGAAYRDAQKRIKEIGQTGVLLAIASKNNPEDALAVFRDNPHMVLQEDDFVSMKINWEPKFRNIAAMAGELNLGLDSFVFLDDNEVEREAVRANLPEVAVPDFPKDIAKLPDTIKRIYDKYFYIAEKTAEDSKKTEQYRLEAQRHKAMENAASLDDYLLSLDIKTTVHKATPECYERTVQLINKTNQFNTNTLRMDMPEFLRYLDGDNNEIFVANVSDRYGDSGLVAVMVTRRDGDTLHIENMLMSCRVMGRQIENAIIHAVASAEAKYGVRRIKASYVPTAKNKPVERLWDSMGFSLASEHDGVKEYEAEINDVKTPLIGAITEL